MVINSFYQLKRLKKNQYLSPAELRALQEERLRGVVRSAYENVPYYRRLFDNAGIRPNDIKTLEDLSKIPITTKNDLQTLKQEEIVAKGSSIDKCIIKYTSGSTGQPLKIFLSLGERDFQILLNLRILVENGLQMTDKVAYIINPYRFPKTKYWFQHMGILRREYLSVFDYPEKHADLIMKLKPDILYGYPSNLTLLALYMRENGIKGINPKIIFSVAEALEPRAKNLIDSVMSADTCDILGTIELGDIAWQCEARNGYHVSADAVVVEFLKNGRPAQPGDEGKIVCTSLYSYTMPFIRYAVDDVCIPSGRFCPCGRTLPMIESIRGRANDFIVLPDGQIVASCFLVIIMQAIRDIGQYRIVQEDKRQILVQLTKGREFDPRTPERIKEEIRKVTKNRLQVKTELIDEIPRDQSGKIRTVVSKVVPDLQTHIDIQESLYVK